MTTEPIAVFVAEFPLRRYFYCTSRDHDCCHLDKRTLSYPLLSVADLWSESNKTKDESKLRSFSANYWLKDLFTSGPECKETHGQKPIARISKRVVDEIIGLLLRPGTRVNKTILVVRTIPVSRRGTTKTLWQTIADDIESGLSPFAEPWTPETRLWSSFGGINSSMVGEWVDEVKDKIAESPLVTEDIEAWRLQDR